MRFFIKGVKGKSIKYIASFHLFWNCAARARFVQSSFRPGLVSSRARFVQGSFRPGLISSRAHFVQRSCPGDISSRARFVQGSFRPGLGSSRARFVQGSFPPEALITGFGFSAMHSALRAKVPISTFGLDQLGKRNHILHDEGLSLEIKAG